MRIIFSLCVYPLPVFLLFIFMQMLDVFWILGRFLDYVLQTSSHKDSYRLSGITLKRFSKWSSRAEEVCVSILFSELCFLLPAAAVLCSVLLPSCSIFLGISFTWLLWLTLASVSSSFLVSCFTLAGA